MNLTNQKLTNAQLDVHLKREQALNKIEVANNLLTAIPCPTLVPFEHSLIQLSIEHNEITEIPDRALT